MLSPFGDLYPRFIVTHGRPGICVPALGLIIMEKIFETNQSAAFDGKRDVVFIILGASREDGERITDAQKNAAMEAAKSVLQIVGADVDANSTAILAPPDVACDAPIVKTTIELWIDEPRSASDSNEE